MEGAHFTFRRMLFYFVNFCFLFVAQIVVKNPKVPVWAKIGTIVLYIAIVACATRYAISLIDHIHEIKFRCNYNWHEKDFRFRNRKEIV